jgi:uncharacterized protein (DUF3084 family)
MTRLKHRIAALDGQLKDAKSELAELNEEKRRLLTEKDAVIEKQKSKMKESASQFSDMYHGGLRDAGRRARARVDGTAPAREAQGIQP